MRIVALVPGGIGDQVLFFPTLTALKAAYPQADIDVIVEPRSKGAYRVCKGVASVIPFDFKAWSSPADWANLLGVLRDRYYDAVIYLGQSWSMGLLLWLTGIPERISYDISLGRRFLTQPVPLKTEQYAAAMYHDLLQGLDIHTPCPDLSINIPRNDLDWAASERVRLGLNDEGYVLIHSGPSQLAQANGMDIYYPVQRWQAIIKDFQTRQPTLPIVVAQCSQNGEFVSELTAAAPEVKVVQADDVGKLAAMVAGANLMLCTGSAPMQLAVALGVYTLALFGPTDPAKRLPQSDKFIAIKSSTGSIGDISADTVLKKVWGT